MEDELPEEWSLERLGALGSLQKGRGGPKRDGVPNGVPVIRYGELYTHHHDVIREFQSFIPPERTEDYTPLEEGDVLFAGAGETADEIGKSAVFLGPEPAYGSGDMIIFRPDGRVDPLFLGYASNGRVANRHKVSVGQGSSIIHIYADDLQSLELPLPPLPEQKKIAAILSSVDDAIAATRKVIEQTKRVKKGLLQDLMTRGIGHTRFKQTEIGEIPEEWDVVPYGELLELSSGKRPNLIDGGSVPVFGGNGIMGQTDRTLVKETTIVIGRVGAAGVVNATQGPAWISDNALYVTDVSDRVDKGFLEIALGWSELQNYATKSSHPSLSQTAVKEVLTALPPLEEQRLIARTFDVVDAMVRRNARQVKALECLKRGLMQDLLKGRVRVPID